MGMHGAASAPPARIISEYPLVASRRLQEEVDAHVATLLAFLEQQRKALRDHPALRHWPSAGAPDVVSADLAIVKDEEAPGGWGLRWVEFQAFTSLIATAYALHLLAMESWPVLRDLAPWQAPPQGLSWLEATRRWAAPVPGVLLERAPASQFTWFDLQAAAHWFRLPIVEPGQLSCTGPDMWHTDASGRRRPVRHLFNRLVLHELGEQREAFERMAGRAEVAWHSHPAWYDGISKALLPQLPMAAGRRAVPASRWRELGLPAHELVAKDVRSHGGSAVHLEVSAGQLDGLEPAADWIVQPRFDPYPLLSAPDGAPLFGELRCVVALPAAGEPWVCMQFARLNRTRKASSSAMAELPGTGLAIVYRPDGLA
jgi:hypothetical protein